MITMVQLVTVYDHSKTLLLLILFLILYISYSWLILQLKVFTSYSPSPISFLPLASSLLVATWFILCIYNCLFVHLFIFLYSTYKWNHILYGLCVWLISLHKMFLRFILVARISTSFLFITRYCFLMDMPYFVYPFIF